ncbi:hypothetical protein [Streptomyces sp. NBC_01233]|uniref:hypothetical protein n=1 Tax=Streptomyces sp. NBC_01233 TaxID=2903787 RepID=UPI002E11E79B|nr:hypothetical protein OG332_03670 [Streptomyces sp. NBC_01233]
MLSEFLQVGAFVGVLWCFVAAVRRAARGDRWALGALLLAAVTGVHYLVGLTHLLVLDVREMCELTVHTRFDPDEHVSTLLPLSNTCNADNDLVPACVNPVLAVLASATLVAGAGTITRAIRTPRLPRRE